MRLTLICALVLTFLASSVSAAVYTLDPVDNPLGDCSGASTGDQCMATGTTANASTCTSAACAICGQDAERNNRPVCVLVTVSASCKCEVQKNGLITTGCSESGQCTYVH